MNLRTAWLTLVLLCSCWLAGCASLGDGKSPAAAAAAAPAGAASAPVSDRAEYLLDIVAPDALQPLLKNYLDLARFQNAPATEGITASELDRLIAAAPAQARALLETEGYFAPVVTVERASATATASANSALRAIAGAIARTTGSASQNTLPLIRISVEPGPRVSVGTLDFEIVGALGDAARAADADAVARAAAVQRAWPLQVGSDFRQAAWSDAKTTTLTRMRTAGYPAATWRSTAAQIDAPRHTANLTLVLDSGPLFRFGAIRVEGLEHFPESSVTNLATFAAGAPHEDRLLLDYQDSLLKLGMFEGAVVEIDPDPATAAAAPVLVRVKELKLQQATFGIGYSANTGPRLTLEHAHRQPFGLHAVVKNKFEIGPDQKRWTGDLTSYPLDGLYRNLLAGSAERLRAADELRTSWSARIGRTQDTARIERLYFAEYVHARLSTAAGTSNSAAVSGNYQWVFRRLDSALLPTEGLSLSAQTALGYATTSASASLNVPDSAGPFGRAAGRITGYWPLGKSWYGTARLEAGQLFANASVGVPDTLLFRAGGDDSVRGYAYRTLGPAVDGVVTSGRMLLTTSVEVARPISASRPAFWWALFADAGNAANRWTEMRPALGYGVGLRWRSPVGPLRIDLAYGEEVRTTRLHLSVGIAF